MKIRWTNDSIRCRITPTELEMLESRQSVRETFPLGAGWHITIIPGTSATAIHFLEGVVQISLSKIDCGALSNPQNEGVYFQSKGETSIRYFIEKDFPCAHPRASEASEAATETFSAPPDFEVRKN